MNRPYFYLISVLLIVAYACRKDFKDNASENPTNTFSISAAKEHYKGLVSTPSKGRTSVLDVKSIDLLWNKAYLSKSNNTEFVETPVISSRKRVTLYNFPQDSLKI